MRKKRTKQLRLALKRRDHIRIVRNIRRADTIDGYVVAIGSTWVLLALSEQGSPDGYATVPVADIHRIEWAPLNHRFYKRSLKTHGAWPPIPPHERIELGGSVRALVDTIAAISPLLAVQLERKEHQGYYIGQPYAWGSCKLYLHQVDTGGRWGEKPRGHKAASITQINFGGIYETNLAAVAGPQPSL